MSDLIGTRIGSYRVEQMLGRGGMGEVYVGFDERLERRVALKTIRREHRLEPAARARFLREAKVLSQLEHPNICQIHDYLEADSFDVLVLELIRGRSLRDALRDGVDRDHAMAIAGQVADGLVVAHERGFIHRDLKPENIMLSTEGVAKVLDFGLSRSESRPARRPPRRPTEPTDADEATVVLESGSDTATHDAAESQKETETKYGTVLGTIGYMSPEQARGETVTAASDLYSFGLLLQELFTGEPPIDRELDSSALLEAMQRGESRPVVGLDPELTRLIERLKSTEPATRPSAVDTAERLAWVRDAPRRRRPARARGGHLPAGADHPRARPGPRPSACGRVSPGTHRDRACHRSQQRGSRPGRTNCGTQADQLRRDARPEEPRISAVKPATCSANLKAPPAASYPRSRRAATSQPCAAPMNALARPDLRGEGRPWRMAA